MSAGRFFDGKQVCENKQLENLPVFSVEFEQLPNMMRCLKFCLFLYNCCY